MSCSRFAVHHSFRPVLHRLTCTRRLHSTSTGGLYHPKVRALPFAMASEEAIVELGPLVAVASGRIHTIIRAAFARWLPFFGTQPLRPVEILPTYLPGWFVDAEVEGRIVRKSMANTVPDSSGELASVPTGPIVFTKSYVPGVSVPPLSRISMRNAWDEDALSRCVPFSDDLLHQQGSEITCLPYTMTPLSLVDAARRGLPLNTKIAKNTTLLDPSSLRCSMIAAYPVLMPVYIARYTIGVFRNESLNLWVVLDASSRERALMHMSNPEPQLSSICKRVGIDSKWIEPLGDVFGDVISMPFDAVELTGATFGGKRDGWNEVELALEGERLNQWICKQAETPDSFLRYEEFERRARSGSQIDFKDLRIREWSSQETEIVRRYFDARDAARAIQTALGDAANISNVVGKFLSAEELQKLAKPTDVYLEPSDLITATKPEWVLRWEQQSDLVSSGKHNDHTRPQ